MKKIALFFVLVGCTTVHHSNDSTDSTDCEEPEPVECDSTDDCPDNLTCQPPNQESYGNCDVVWTCQEPNEDLICTYDLHLYCDCDGNQFGDSGTLACVDTKFDYHGWCEGNESQP